MIKKRTFKNRGHKKKKAKRDNFGDNEKEQLINYDKKRKKRLTWLIRPCSKHQL